MSDLKGILLLFSSGVPSTNRFHRNDGSISGLIFLIAFISFSCCAVFVSSFRGRNVTASMTPPGNAYLIVLCALAFLACLVIIYTNAKRIKRNGNNTLYRRDNTAWLKLKFLYLFGAGGIAYQIIAYIYRRECSSPHVHLDNILAVHIALIIFFLTQTAFIRIMFKYVLKNSIVIFYTVSFILVTNVAVWTYYTVTGYYGTKDYYSVSNISDCNYNSTLISKVYWRSRVIVDPMIMEYAMLASIFVFEMWPLYLQKEQSDTEDTRRNMEELEDRLEICSINVYDQITETSPLIQNKSEETKCCFEVKGVLISILTRMKMHCNVFVGILAVFPPALLDILDIFVSKGTYTFPLIISFCFSNSVMIGLILRCFFLLYRDCCPTTSNNFRTVSHCLLVLSLFGFTFFMTLSLFANIFRDDDVSPSLRGFVIYHEISIIIASYLHTIFILQMSYCRSYKQSGSRTCLRLHNICLTLAVMQLGYWAKNSFISASFRWHKGFESQYFGHKTYDILFHVFFPFGVFFHFKCFILFYGIFKRFAS